MYQSKVCVQEFGHLVPGLDIQPEQLENDNPASKKSSRRLRNTTSDISFFSVDWHESIAEWLRWVAVSQAFQVWFQQSVLELFAASRPFCVALSPSVHWHASFSIVALSIRLGHRARNSDSTSIHYCEIWKLKKTFMLNLTISQNWWLASFKWKRKWPRLVNFTPDNSSQIDKRIVWDKFSTWSRLQRFTHKKVEKTVYKIFYGYK